MTEGFKFGQPPPSSPPPQGQEQPAQPPAGGNPFSGPPPNQPQVFTSPADVAAALGGFGAGKIDARDPFLPLGFTGLVEWLGSESKTGRDTGLAIYIKIKVEAIADGGAGGGTCEPPVPKNLNTIPATVGGVYVIPIRGFSKPDAAAFAISDLKLACVAALEPDGLTRQMADQLPEDEWNKLAFAVVQNDPRFHGKRMIVTTSKVTNKSGQNAKLKHTFYPERMASGG